MPAGEKGHDSRPTGAPAVDSEGSQELTAVVLTLNEAEHVAQCVGSLSWTDRVIVFDAFSSDETVDLARKAGAQVTQEAFDNFAQQRNAALEAITTDWVFFVDADERGTPDLGEEVRHVINARPEAAWYVPRLNYIFGRLTRGAGWYPDYQLRLFRHGKVRYERPVHEVAVVGGQIGYLQNTLLHYNYRDVEHFHRTQRRYTEYDAQILHEQGLRPKVYTPLTQPLRHFWWRYVALKGYREGFHGLRLSLYMAYYEWVKYRKLRELRA